MQVILLRHGLRNNGFGDVPLSTEGTQQAVELAENPVLQKIDHILCSPKLRTRQTVEPLSTKLGIEIQVEPDLDQRKSIESHQEFVKRVDAYINQLIENFSEQKLLICTHSDWLQIAILNLEDHLEDPAAHCLFSCAEHKVLEFKDHRWSIK